MGGNSSKELHFREQEEIRKKAHINYDRRIKSYNIEYHGDYMKYIEVCRIQYELDISKYTREGINYSPQYEIVSMKKFKKRAIHPL